MTKKQAISRVKEIAAGEIGYLEKSSGKSLDDKNANAGSANYTKYWRDVCPELQAQAWCACFVSWVFQKAFGRADAGRLLKHWPFTYCPTLAGLTTNKTPKEGSIILFFRNGVYAHTGIVTAVEGGKITTVEGNTSGGGGIIANGGGVFRKSYAISTLSGNTKYFMPDYGILSGSTADPNAGSAYTVGAGKVEVRHFLQGAEDVQIKTIQRLLNDLGFTGKDKKPLSVDGTLGENTAHAIAAFQKKAGMTGINFGTVATKTWKKLINAD